MGMDIDWVVANAKIKELESLLSSKPHGERKEIADDIINFVEQMQAKWSDK